MKHLRNVAIMLVLTLMLGLFGSHATAATAERQGQRYDFDGSRGRTVADATLLLRAIDGHKDGIIAEGEGDVSGDGRLSVYDAVCFLRLLLNDTFDIEDSLKIVTYNIKCGYYATGNTLDTIAQMLKDVDADIVGLQEVDYLSTRSGATVDQLKYLAEKAGYRYYKFTPVVQLGKTKVPITTNVTANLYGHGILSKYPITGHERIYFETQGTNVDGSAKEVRALGRYEIDVNGKKLAFYNTHLDGGVGRAQYKEIQDHYMVKDQYAIFTADMNETLPELEGYLNEDRIEVLTDSGRIDHIFVSNDTISWYADEEGATGFVVQSYAVPAFPYDGSTVAKCSDHNLWYATVMLKDN